MRHEESGVKRGSERKGEREWQRERIYKRKGGKEGGRGSHCATEPSNKNVKKSFFQIFLCPASV
jgi:hypothetical protein